MARDRKRAKQRQRRRAAQQRTAAARKPGAAAPDEPVVDEIVHEDHEPDSDAAPDPLAHASADVDIAELAEASVQEPGAPDRPLEDKDYPHPDEVEGADVIEEEHDDATVATGRRPPRRAAAAGADLPKEGNRFVNFLRACVAELRRVQWPDRRQVGQATAVVLVFVVIAGGYLGLLDAVFSRVVEAIL